jgi:hypothetical protein
MIAEKIPQVQALTVDEQWQLMIELEEKLWSDDRVGARADEIFAELQRRKQYFEAHPESAMTLEEARRRMFASRK